MLLHPSTRHFTDQLHISVTPFPSLHLAMCQSCAGFIPATLLPNLSSMVCYEACTCGLCINYASFFAYGISCVILLQVTVLITDVGGLTYITVTQASSNFNRFWFRIMSTGSDEHVYGGGEQFSYFDLNGRNYPLWLQEQVQILKFYITNKNMHHRGLK